MFDPAALEVREPDTHSWLAEPMGWAAEAAADALDAAADCCACLSCRCKQQV
jgi:hypothetical protein